MNPNKPCYLFFDFDGTIYVDHKIADETLRAMTAVQAMGHKLILNTGRSYGECSLSPVLFEVPWDGYVLGAGDIRYQGRELFSASIPIEDAEQWMYYCMRHRYDLVFGGQDSVVFYRFHSHPAPFSEAEIQESIMSLRNEAAQNRLTKLTILQKPDYTDMPKTEQNVIRQHYADIFAKGCDKGSAIRLFCRETGAPPEQCVCFGDSLNDIDMFRVCPTSVCMKSSPQELIDLATYHAKTDLGVAEGLQYLFDIGAAL